MSAHTGRLGWLALCLLLALPAAALPIIDLEHPSLWPPSLQALVLHPHQGWRQSLPSWWAAAWLHGSEPHLWRNLAGVALVAGMGWAARVGPPATLAWLLAWPLTHIGMLWRPELTSYIGLSGVLHAGAAIVALQQIIRPPTPAARWPGWALLLGLITKVVMENPWGPVLILSSASAIKVAPWAHFSGVLAGLASGGLVLIGIKHLAPQFKRQ